MFPLSAVADNKSKAITQDECTTLAKLLFGRYSVQFSKTVCVCVCVCACVRACVCVLGEGLKRQYYKII